VPYGFATDRWADLGNLSVYRHDNGADAYEIFDFLITQQEVGHIFDNYRRGRQDFSVRAAADRSLSRYNEKIRDGAKGLSLMKNYVEELALDNNLAAEGYWTLVAPVWWRDNILASGMVFDHFTRMVSRPQSGGHFRDGADPVLRSEDDAWGDVSESKVTIPNGATGFFSDVNPGGRPVENRLSSSNGEYDSELTINAGSYYDKINVAMLMTESVDNFISDSRMDFVDARYRAVSLADLFPDGYRRFLGNALTWDDQLKGPRIATYSGGTPLTDDQGFPKLGIGWTSWWGETPVSCFPGRGSTVCSSYGEEPDPFGAEAPQYTTIIDPQIGWEVQKFLIAWTLLYLPENQQQSWIDMMRIWELGKDADPGFENRIEFHSPFGKTYVAMTYGKETVSGKTVEKGIAGRVLEYANELVTAGFVTDPGPDLNGDDKPDWFLPKLNPDTGTPLVKWDPTVMILRDGLQYFNGAPGCNKDESYLCQCSENRACVKLQSYVEIPFFLRQTLDAYKLVSPHPKGVYD